MAKAAPLDVLIDNERSAVRIQFGWALLLVLVGLLFFSLGAYVKQSAIASLGSAYVLSFLKLPYADIQKHRDRIAAFQVLRLVAEKNGPGSEDATRVASVVFDAVSKAAATIAGK
jgi:hypothetical protein